MRLQPNYVVQVVLQDQAMFPNGAVTTTNYLTTNKNPTDSSIPIELVDPSANE